MSEFVNEHFGQFGHKVKGLTLLQDSSYNLKQYINF